MDGAGMGQGWGREVTELTGGSTLSNCEQLHLPRYLDNTRDRLRNSMKLSDEVLL